jgi:DNA-binding IscR family transcriptional regulator
MKVQVDIGRLSLSCAGKLIYLFLCSASDKQGTVTLPVRIIAETVGVSPSTVRCSLRTLKEKGLISIQPGYKTNGMRSVNCYRLRRPI